MEIIFAILFLTSYHLIKKNWGKSKLFSEESVYCLRNPIEDDDYYTDKQKLIIEYLKMHKSEKESVLLKRCNTTIIVIRNLIDKGAIEKMPYKKLSTKEIFQLIITLIILAFSFIIINYFILVKINLRYYGIFIFIMLFLYFGLSLIHYYLKFSVKLFKNIVVLAGLFFFLFSIFYLIFGGRAFTHAKAYSELIEVKEADFLNDINTVDINNLPVVDKSYGSKLGSLKLGEFPGIGSEFETGEYSDIIYQGKQYLVAPLEYRGFFKWSANNDAGTPGYILIDKVTSETQLINIRENTGQGMKFVPSAFFGQDLVRHAYYSGLSKYRLENKFFEIDEDGNPYYILQYSLPTIFINGGHKIKKIAVVNAINGEVSVYDPDDVPAWVESVYPNTLIVKQLNYWGSLQNGWLNSVFAQRGVLETSQGTRVIMNEGELFYFTGMTSVGSDESTIGFIYANMKTKETKLYRFSGATEEAAMNKVLTLIAQRNISSSFPFPLNISDNPTYFLLIKGEDGRILRYVFMKIQDLEFYSISETSKLDAYNRFIVKLSEDDDSVSTKIQGTITDITSYVNNGFTIYWVEINNDKRYMINVGSFLNDEMIYFISRDIGDEIEFYVVGSNVVDFGQ
jgi:hypothetical protein